METFHGIPNSKGCNSLFLFSFLPSSSFFLSLKKESDLLVHEFFYEGICASIKLSKLCHLWLFILIYLYIWWKLLIGFPPISGFPVLYYGL